MLQFEPLIDLTSFGTVRRYLNGPGSPITDVLFVREARLLATMAALLTDEHPTDAQRAQFARWIEQGRLKVGVHRNRFLEQPGREAQVDVDAISDDAHCRVLFLPPYYLVHLPLP